MDILATNGSFPQKPSFLISLNIYIVPEGQIRYVHVKINKPKMLAGIFPLNFV